MTQLQLPQMNYLNAGQAIGQGLNNALVNERLQQTRQMAPLIKTEQQIKTHLEGMKYIAGSAQMVNATNYPQWHQNLIKMGLSRPGDLPDQYDPAIMDRLFRSANNNLPKAIQVYEYWNKLSPQGKKDMLVTMRSQAIVNTGAQQLAVNPANPAQTTVVAENKPKPGQMAAPETDKSAPWYGMKLQNQVDAAKSKFGAEADKAVQNAQSGVQQAQNIANKVARFIQLNEGTSTGPQYSIPIFGSIGKGYKNITDPAFQEMTSISDYLTPLMRNGLPGSASDTDTKMFRGAAVGVEKLPQANKNIATGLLSVSQNIIDRANFLSDYASQHGYIRGANKEWNAYLRANPIFDPDATKTDYKLNPHRLSYQQWVDAGRPTTPHTRKSARNTPALPSVNAQGWKLMQDASGNKAYVGPNGEVQEVQ